MTNAPTHSHVFYSDRKNGWVAQSRDADGNQIGAAAYYYLKTAAVRHAKHDGLPVSIFGKNALLQRMIYTD